MGLDSVEILMEIEDSFGIEIPQHEAERICTVGDLYNAVWQKLEGKYSDKDTGTSRQEMEMNINLIIADMAGLELEDITSDKKIADDLGID